MFTHVHMPSLGGATEWLNSEPLGPAELRGRVVRVNFAFAFYLQGIDSAEIIDAVHTRRAPMIPVSTSVRL